MRLPQNYTTRTVVGYTHVDFGYTVGGNKHAGVSVSLDAKLFPRQCISQIIAPSRRTIRGRVGAVRIKSAKYDVCVISAYWPPSFCSGQVRRVFEAVAEEVDGIISALPQRCIPIIACDANARLGLHKEPGMGGVSQVQSRAVGREQPEAQNLAGGRFMDLLEKHGMAAINTFHAAGPTFYHTSGGKPTRIDYLCAPRTMIDSERIKTCEVMDKLGDQLQLITTARKADHRPLAVRFGIQLSFEEDKDREMWDKDLLSTSLKKGGVKLEEFRQKLKEASEATAESWASLEPANVSEKWASLAKLLHGSAYPIFKKAPFQRSPEAIRLSKLRTQLIQKRANSRLRLLGASGTLMWAIKMATNHWALLSGLLPQGILTQWLLVVRLGKCQARLKKHVRCEHLSKRLELYQQLEEACKNKDAAGQWRLARALAGKRIGPKSRPMGRIAANVPSLDQWRKHEALPGPLGGCSAHATTLEDHTDAYHDRPPHSCTRPTHHKQAKYMLAGVKYALNGMRLRKAVQEGDCPVEVWRMIFIDTPTLFDERQLNPVKRRPVGIGCDRSLADVSIYIERLKELLAEIIASRLTPWQWHTSVPWHLDKKSQKGGCYCIRLVHGMLTFAKAFYKNLLREQPKPIVPEYAYGCVKGRRRETAVAVQLITGARLAMAGFPQVVNFRDVTNAFPSLDTRFIFKALIFMTDPMAMQLIKDHIFWAVFEITHLGDKVLFRPGSGIFPGGSIAAELFNYSYWTVLSNWVDDRVGVELLTAVSPIDGCKVQTAMTAFVDDVADRTAGSTIHQAIQYEAANTDALDVHLVPAGIVQNKDKAVRQIRVKGKGSQAVMRAAYAYGEVHGLHIPRCAIQARYLGPYLHFTEAFAPECANRVRAFGAAWAAMSGFWSSNAPVKLKRQIFIGQCISVLYSGWCRL